MVIFLGYNGIFTQQSSWGFSPTIIGISNWVKAMVNHPKKPQITMNWWYKPSKDGWFMALLYYNIIKYI